MNAQLLSPYLFLAFAFPCFVGILMALQTSIGYKRYTLLLNFFSGSKLTSKFAVFGGSKIFSHMVVAGYVATILLMLIAFRFGFPFIPAAIVLALAGFGYPFAVAGTGMRKT